MKKSIKFASILTALVLMFGVAGCSDDSSGGGEPKGSEKDTDKSGLTTLKIQEDATGFVSSTFTKVTDFPCYTGTGYLDGGTSENGNIVYTVSAEEDITDAKIAIHYLATEVTRVRAALVSVNGTVINADKPLAMATDVKVKKNKCTSENWKDTAYLEGVSLQKGSNSIIVTGAPDGAYTAADGTSITIDGQKKYLNYVDYLIVIGKGIDYGTDTTKFVSLSTVSENSTAGSATSDAKGSNVAENSEITFTATPNSGWKFECWSDGSKENPHKVTVSTNTIMFAHFIPENYTAPTDLVGYATVTTDSGANYTITGGAGASDEYKITISSYSDLTAKKDILSLDVPKIITISGTISTAANENPLLSEKYTIGSNSTIYGDTTNQGRLKNIEFIVEGENVIIRNMMFGEVISWDGYAKSGADDALSLNGATHVWVDHCEFQSHLTPQDLDGNTITEGHNYYSTNEKWKKDFYDGLLDIKNGSTWITISNCYFHDHYKASLCSSGDSKADKNTTTGATDSDMRITFYNNYWKNINARQPLFRWGKAHIFNSYFVSETSCAEMYNGSSNVQSTGINCRAGSEIYIDNNTFENLKTPIGYYNNDDATSTGYWVNKDNEFLNCTNSVASSSTSYKPPYTWSPKSASEAKTYVQSNAGVGKLSASDLN
ncbi:MAG: hypothetical protein IJ158_03740 [Treponema sp.]|nr:hypothetical protein [Treponema sp.]